MEIELKIQKLRKAMKSSQRHVDLDHVIEIQKEYKAHITNVGLDDYLKQFNLREDEEMFKQRVRLTNLISKPVASSIKKPFYKVSRNENVKSEITMTDTVKLEAVKKMMSNFYGSNEFSERGLDFWLKNRFLELVFTEPNAFIVVEWNPAPLNEVVEPYPFEVPSENVVNYTKKHGRLVDLLIKASAIKNVIDKDGEIQEEIVDAWTVYEIGSSVRMVEVDPEFLKKTGVVIGENQYLIKDEGDNGKTFLATYNETKLDFIPAFQVGYLRDEITNGRTFVSPLDSAIPYFRKSLKAVSELDLSITLHTFPQKIQFVSACKFRDGNNACSEGILSRTKTTCPNCSGTGLEIHKSGQDAILHRLPEDKTEMFDLDKTLIYKTPPIDLIKFQDDNVRALKQDIHLSVFNSTMFLANDPMFAKTATEIDFNTEGINDTLFPYAEKFSEMWKTVVHIFIKLTGYEGTFELKHIFPSDLKLKNQSMLVAELKVANESNAPSFLIDQITSQIAGQIYNGDELNLKKYQTRHKFFPFNGKSKEEIGLLMASPYVSEWTKILYANFEAIFTDIEKANPNFWFWTYSKQWDAIIEAVKPFEEEIKEKTNTERFEFGFGNSSDGGAIDPTVEQTEE